MINKIKIKIFSEIKIKIKNCKIYLKIIYYHFNSKILKKIQINLKKKYNQIKRLRMMIKKEVDQKKERIHL